MPTGLTSCSSGVVSLWNAARRRTVRCFSTGWVEARTRVSSAGRSTALVRVRRMPASIWVASLNHAFPINRSKTEPSPRMITRNNNSPSSTPPEAQDISHPVAIRVNSPISTIPTPYVDSTIFFPIARRYSSLLTIRLPDFCLSIMSPQKPICHAARQPHLGKNDL